MRCLFIAFISFIVLSAWAPVSSAETSNAAGSSPLTATECTRLIRRSLFNMTIDLRSPMGASLMNSCVAGRDHYTRSYFNCVFAETYSDTLDCAYKERGIDRSKKEPMLAFLEPGDTGGYEGQSSDVAHAVYKGADPHTTFDSISRDRYLDDRDNVLKSLDRVPPADGHLPRRSQHSEIKVGDTSYWIVREDYADLQLVKIVRDDEHGSNTVTCGRYGTGDRIDIGKGYCAAMLQKYLHVALTEQ